MSEFVKLTEYCDVNMGQSPASSSYNAEQRGIPFFQGNADFGNQNPHVRLWCNAPTKIAHCGDLLLSVRAPIGALNIADCTCCIGRGLAALTAKQKVCDPSWLYFALKSKISELQAQGTGSTFKAINKAALQNLLLPSCSLSEQQHIASVLRKVCCLITVRQQQLSKLDQLAKSRFIEMFGDPVANPRKWDIKKISDFATVKIGPFGSALHADDYITQGHPVINPSHIVDGTVVPDNLLTISESKYCELSAYHLRQGDVVIGRRGEIGRAAVITDSGLLCGTGSMFVRISDSCRPDFLQKIISYPTFKAVLEDKAVGVTMKNLNAGMLESSYIPLPPLELQNEFAAFVEQLDKSKVICNKMHKMVEFSLFRV